MICIDRRSINMIDILIIGGNHLQAWHIGTNHRNLGYHALTDDWHEMEGQVRIEPTKNGLRDRRTHQRMHLTHILEDHLGIEPSIFGLKDRATRQ